MNRDDILKIVQPLLECPTAPMFETAVSEEIQRQLSGIEGLKLQVDASGNLIAWFGRDRPKYVFVAHMDHPGWQLHPNRRFLGTVPLNLQDKGQVQEFGEFGMWDLPAFRLDGDRLYSRACDDLIGCAIIIAMLRTLAQTGFGGSVAGVFTRAEEVGFIGAIHLARSKLLPSDATIISLETSKEMPPAKMGAGPIIRVGDLTSIFDPQTADFFVEVAKNEKIGFQRCLMPGGTCEATAFQLYGYRSAALCIALGNYHNCTPDGRIDSEFIDLGDLDGLIGFCVAIVATEATAETAREALRKRLEARLEEFPLR
ncbi:MAG: M20/M25/M40 family metallo-hydrolase [Verrucomicrobia bacterium]|nr:M20/M25/M40 family metallo-hydrolase [Verrucomicrobiota bacterium]